MILINNKYLLWFSLIIVISFIIFQTFLFFTAGFETSTKSITYGLFELARKQEIQDRVRKEINEVLNKYNGEITLECLSEMKYLNQVVEGMFLHHFIDLK